MRRLYHFKSVRETEDDFTLNFELWFTAKNEEQVYETIAERFPDLKPYNPREKQEHYYFLTNHPYEKL